LDVYPLADSGIVDLSSMGTYSDVRRGFRIWEVAPSDVSGCVHLHSAQLVDPSTLFDPLSDKCPTVVVLEALKVLGWRPGRDRTPHTPEDPGRTFNGYRPSSNKLYFQCVLAIDSLFAAGVLALHCKQCLDYYKCLRTLPDKHLILANLPAASYKTMLRLKQPGVAPLLALPAVVPNPAILNDPIDSDSDVVIGDVSSGADDAVAPIASDADAASDESARDAGPVAEAAPNSSSDSDGDSETYNVVRFSS
jgi:hypothetical protein